MVLAQILSWSGDLYSDYCASYCPIKSSLDNNRLISDFKKSTELWFSYESDIDIPVMTQTFDGSQPLGNIYQSLLKIPEQNYISSISEKLQFIRSKLGIRVSDLALVFNVERQSIYGWIKAIYSPEADKAKKIDIIYSIAQLSVQFFNSYDSNLCYRQISGRGSIFDEFLNENPNLERIKELFRSLSHSEETNRMMKLNSVSDALKRHGLSDALDEHGSLQVDITTGKVRSN